MKGKMLVAARRYYDLGLHIHWLGYGKKSPIDKNWAKTTRKEWDDLASQYHRLKGNVNVGACLGRPLHQPSQYLAVVDIDVKGEGEVYRKEAREKVSEVFGDALANAPSVASGRGNGSGHLYFLTPKPVAYKRLGISREMVKVRMPSTQPSGHERQKLTPKELESGLRLRPAWEVSILGMGQQVVLPPSVHPDTQCLYTWLLEMEQSP